jgi:hypothetical protein
MTSLFLPTSLSKAGSEFRQRSQAEADLRKDPSQLAVVFIRSECSRKGGTRLVSSDAEEIEE